MELPQWIRSVPEWVWLVLILLLYAIGFGVASSIRKRRAESFRRFGCEVGLEPDEKLDVLSRLSGLTLFQSTSSRLRRCRNVLRGTTPTGETLLFDYWYARSRHRDDEDSTTFEQTVVAFRFPKANLPRFSISRATMFDKVTEVLGAQDLDFESHPHFSKTFSLSGDDDRAVRALFDPALLELFEGRGKGWPYVVEGRGEWIIVYTEDHRAKPRELRGFFDEASAVAGRFGGRVPAFRRGPS